ncbi:MAG: hypothetical protein RJA57_269 [Bacteroidota bacterium]
MHRLLPLLLLTLLLCCRKEGYIRSPDAVVEFSSDTLKFDTVFVQAGSTYRTLRIKNPNDQKLRLSSLQVMGSTPSLFRMNVDGMPGSTFTNLDIDAGDSLYVFVQVQVNPSAGNLPFILRDSIEVRFNGTRRVVQLEAWGQNAHFHRDRVITAPETWNNDLPHVILGSLTVNTGQTLTINKGSRIHVQANAPILVQGTLKVYGLRDTADRVLFTGARLDEPYRDFPGSWPGLFFLSGSVNNEINYALIRNAYQAIGLQDPATNGAPKLTLRETVIDNAWDAGIIAVNSGITAQNCLVMNSGKNVVIARGGSYSFLHCTLVSYGNRYIDHTSPVLSVSNFTEQATAPLNALFRNCIIWGDNGIVDNEVVVLRNGTNPFTVLFDHTLWKVQTPPTLATTNQIIANQAPGFDSVNIGRNYFDFRLRSGSPAINKGALTGLLTDLDGKPRPVGLPDLGCFERQ